MRSEYDPLFEPLDDDEAGPRDDLARVRELFAAASRPYLRSPLSWLVWGVVLPATALAHPAVLARFGLRGALFLWSAAVLAGGLVEIVAIRRSRGGHRATPLASWVFRAQGNLSAVAVVLSVLLLATGQGRALPGLWLLLLGHSFQSLGGLAFRPFRAYGLAFQVAALAALWPTLDPLVVFAAATGVANLWMAYAVWRR